MVWLIRLRRRLKKNVTFLKNKSFSKFTMVFIINLSLGKKNNLGKYLHKLQKIFPNDYNYFPKTWILPYQLE